MPKKSSQLSIRMFEGVKVIGEMTAAQRTARLGEDPLSASRRARHAGRNVAGPHKKLNRARVGGGRGLEKGVSLFGGQPKPWQHTSHQFGYVAAPTAAGSGSLDIVSAATIAADTSLRTPSLVVRLDRLRMLEYPGGGTHRILLTLKARNQATGDAESVAFNQEYRVRQGQAAGVAGYPIFIGLNVTPTGADLHCMTTNVKNDDDEKTLDILDSPTVQGGLNLLTTAQPALRPFTDIALGLAKTMAQRHRNVSVQDFFLGLDFDQAAAGAARAR